MRTQEEGEWQPTCPQCRSRAENHSPVGWRGHPQILNLDFERKTGRGRSPPWEIVWSMVVVLKWDPRDIGNGCGPGTRVLSESKGYPYKASCRILPVYPFRSIHTQWENQGRVGRLGQWGHALLRFVKDEPGWSGHSLRGSLGPEHKSSETPLLFRMSTHEETY